MLKTLAFVPLSLISNKYFIEINTRLVKTQANPTNFKGETIVLKLEICVI